MIFEPVTQKHGKVIIIGGGESLEDFDFEQLKDFDGAVITVNNVIFHLPRVDYWITVDPMERSGLPQKGMRMQEDGVYYYCAYPDLEKYPHDKPFYQEVDGVHYLERIVPSGAEYKYFTDKDNYRLQEEKNKITTGDSIYGALGLAYHFEAKKIVLLGVDGYGYGHWYDKKDPYNAYNQKDFKKKYLDNIPRIYRQSVKQLSEKGVEVLNGSPSSIIDCFKRVSPQEAINWIRN